MILISEQYNTFADVVIMSYCSFSRLFCLGAAYCQFVDILFPGTFICLVFVLVAVIISRFYEQIFSYIHTVVLKLCRCL